MSTRNEDHPARMWPFWRDKKGLTYALEDYYPETLKRNRTLQLALVQIESAEALIDKIMTEAAQADDSDDY